MAKQKNTMFVPVGDEGVPGVGIKAVLQQRG
jgi:hypothetical protein